MNSIFGKHYEVICLGLFLAGQGHSGTMALVLEMLYLK